MEYTVQNIKNKLFEMQDLEYKAFHSRLMPTISPETIIGVRTPALRKFAKEMAKYGDLDAFMSKLPHEFYEENNLHGFLIESMKDFDKCMDEVDRFLPYVDNWATCDMMRPKIFKKNPQKLLPKIEAWMASGETYTVRYGIGMLMTYFLDEEFDVKYVKDVAAVESEEYYVKMMVAWYFATALAKQWDEVIPFIEKGVLDINDEGVNDYFPPENKRVPFRNMVYIGDSDTDIPCMKLVNGYGGHSIGVYDPETIEKEKVYRMIADNRIRYFAPADYTENSELDQLVKSIIDHTAAHEILESKHVRDRLESDQRKSEV